MTRLARFLSLAFLGLALVPLRAQTPTPDKGIAAVLKPFVDSNSLAGAVVLVADKDKILAFDAVGHADIEKNSLMGPRTVFWIASQSKPITAAGLMILVDEGKVKLDDPVEKYLPEFADVRLNGAKPKTPITVRQLLMHTSGMAFKSPEESPTLDKLSLADAIKTYVKVPLVSEPGTKYLYSNCGINSAGRIIEVVSGMPFETFMEKRMFETLGMKETTFWPSEEQATRLAKTYKPDQAKKGLEETKIPFLAYPLTDKKRHIMPAGGYFSTAEDVARFCQMVLRGGELNGKRVLSEDAVREMTRRQTDKSISNAYGLGWAVGDGFFGHGGAMATNMTIDTKRGLVTVFLVQHQGFPGDGGKSLGTFRKAAEEKYGAK